MRNRQEKSLKKGQKKRAPRESRETLNPGCLLESEIGRNRGRRSEREIGGRVRGTREGGSATIIAITTIISHLIETVRGIGGEMVVKKIATIGVKGTQVSTKKAEVEAEVKIEADSRGRRAQQ
jgi:hypothetical protein